MRSTYYALRSDPCIPPVFSAGTLLLGMGFLPLSFCCYWATYAQVVRIRAERHQGGLQQQAHTATPEAPEAVALRQHAFWRQSECVRDTLHACFPSLLRCCLHLNYAEWLFLQPDSTRSCKTTHRPRPPSRRREPYSGSDCCFPRGVYLDSCSSPAPALLCAKPALPSLQNTAIVISRLC